MDKELKIDEKKLTEVLKKAAEKNKLASTMARPSVIGGAYRPKNQPFFSEAAKELGKSLYRIDDPDEFWTPAMEKALAYLTDKEYAKNFRNIITLLMKGQYSASPYRRSYRSNRFRYHANNVVIALEDYVREYYFEGTVKDRLFQEYILFYLPIALKLQQGDAEIEELIREAIYGDNTKISLNVGIIAAIITSDRDDLIDDLLKLLAAAKLQEGLRQRILELADLGSLNTLRKILKFCIDENMFRFSGAIRALNTWLGLAVDNSRVKLPKKIANIAYDVLADEKNIDKYLESPDAVEAYVALWGVGCREIVDAEQRVTKLLDDPKRYRRLLGWYFVCHSDSEIFQSNVVKDRFEERDDEILAWTINCIPNGFGNRLKNYEPRPKSYDELPPRTEEEKKQCAKLFGQLKSLLLHIGSRTLKFTGAPFPWSEISCTADRVAGIMWLLAENDLAYLQELVDLQKILSADCRYGLVKAIPSPKKDPGSRPLLLKFFNDKSVYIKFEVFHKLSQLEFDDETLAKFCDALRSKNLDTHGELIKGVERQSVETIAVVINRLLTSTNENQIQSGLELLIKHKSAALIQQNQAELEALKSRDLSTSTKTQLDKIVDPNANASDPYSLENGLGLYDPKAAAAYDDSLPPLKFDDSEILTEKQIEESLITSQELEALFERLEAIFVKHADYEYEIVNAWGSRNTILFGNCMSNGNELLPASSGCKSFSDEAATPEAIPFWNEFAEVLGDYLTDPEKWFELYYQFQLRQRSTIFSLNAEPWLKTFQSLGIQVVHHEVYQKYPRFRCFIAPICACYKLLDQSRLYAVIQKRHSSILAMLGDNVGKVAINAKKRVYGHDLTVLRLIRDLLGQLSLSNEDFTDYFYQLYKIKLISLRAQDSANLESVNPSGDETSNDSDRQDEALSRSIALKDLIGLEQFFRAYDLGIISKDALLGNLLAPSSTVFKDYHTGLGSETIQKLQRKYASAREIVDQIADRVVSIESQRGDLKTDVTAICSNIKRIESARLFCRLLAGLGKENFFRYDYYWNENDSKQAILSSLLKRCYPSKDDTPETLAEELKSTNITPERLVEAAMYAPQWASFVEKSVGWKGLKSGIRFFHAHISEEFSAEKETETALYSSISPQQFNFGAFDRNWFFDVYEQLGEQRFQTLYNCAKYIAQGNNHYKRSQLYCDAALGRIDEEQLRQEIVEKRNQDKLRSYALLPIKPGDVQETLRRYEFLARFLKESKQFGAQRRESERLAYLSAMDNLAMSANYSDVNRLIWQMESAKSDDLKALFEPTTIDDVVVKLVVDELGDTTLCVEKNGKALKSVPKAIAKHEVVLELKQAMKELKEQKSRARESLERAMTESAEFEAAELRNILRSLTLRPLVDALVWTTGDDFGLLRLEDAKLLLLNSDGETKNVDDKKLRIAHPHDLRNGKVWTQWMRYFYDQRLVQPFKQVFREYYPITEDEKRERTISHRYEGHQVQTSRTIALLKSRGWTVDYDEGVQRVFHKEGLVVQLLAMADWYTPADTEAPTLETIEFYDLKTFEPVPLEDVPPILFSEVMRDIDLVVSVAHVGGVDPESSASTVEMRVAIAGELTRLLKLGNVSWAGSHAKIVGKLAKYSVHMGSGIVHAEGKGAIDIIAVQSQARGRVFLPFADDDPKTAEIMSKIVLLSEDGKIKDPVILRQIKD